LASETILTAGEASIHAAALLSREYRPFFTEILPRSVSAFPRHFLSAADGGAATSCHGRGARPQDSPVAKERISLFKRTRRGSAYVAPLYVGDARRRVSRKSAGLASEVRGLRDRPRPWPSAKMLFRRLPIKGWDPCLPGRYALPFYTTPWSSIASATLRKPAMLAPAT
jgi:hypothetical protein